MEAKKINLEIEKSANLQPIVGKSLTESGKEVLITILSYIPSRHMEEEARKWILLDNISKAKKDITVSTDTYDFLVDLFERAVPRITTVGYLWKQTMHKKLKEAESVKLKEE